jgi:hypothetical protein
MMDQLGIKALRPGPSGNEKAANHANYDEAKANPFPNLPDVLTLNSGRRVTTAELWWAERRPEIVKGLEEYVYGRVPKDMPGVSWSVVATDREVIGGHPVIAKELLGHVDNSTYPLISVKPAHDACDTCRCENAGASFDDVWSQRFSGSQ